MANSDFGGRIETWTLPQKEWTHSFLSQWIRFSLQFEEQGARELKQIFEGQSYIGKSVHDLHRKLDEVIGRQERTLSQLSIMAQTGSVQPQGQVNQQVSNCAVFVCRVVEISVFHSLRATCKPLTILPADVLATVPGLLLTTNATPS